MIINSPVGRLPFMATSVTVHRGAVRLDGAMGTWPTSVEIPLVEIPSIARNLLPLRAVAMTACGVATALAARRLAGRRARR